MPSASQSLDEALQFLRRGHRAGRIGGACDEHAGERRLAVRALDMLGRQRPARVGADLDLDSREAERLQDVAVGRVAGRGHGDPLARIEGAEKDQVEAARGAGRHHHPRRRQIDAVGLAIVAGDPLAERHDAERLRVAEAAALQRFGGRSKHGAWRRRPRLPDLHVDHGSPGRFERGRRRQHVHGVKRLDVAPAGRLQHGDFNITCLSFVA